MRRHDLLTVDPIVWEAMLGRHPALRDLPLLADWSRHGWPVIVRRRMAGDALGSVPAALPLPPEHGKRRLAFSFPDSLGLLPLAPVSVSDAALTAPDAWQAVIAGLVELGETVGVSPRVFGSLLWQHLTGLSYLTMRSDLDLLWSGADRTRVETLVAGLLRLDRDSPIRIDGELELPDGSAFNWREFADSRDCSSMLLKTMDGVETRAIAGLFQGCASS
ncbi:malonate decarboxylase holo-[acyl-carrier-protein] synthase (plasmid) [Lichenicola cladoniae]|uniref:Malonate decarboxylase holo-[acyl-carrier-protein] synthase n=1 Tax=Lichenicola cladoniae TaxID=1484109 RepID=A0A6M8HZ21_9PROT|nr:malonate decarboxylase holo-[acyl-carrier-protein] synthase [Lichenicola cladoniae]NPD66796.1 malonate decarboxylase holo-[acyl-carrier-protein] synthase [Acetobacteraceae bacterium]QKE93506.1 malonate decarboxylase holo-[acyl-carrier-protein] synthase [Lichenicola cladoniae]